MTATRAILLKRLEAEALQIRRNVWPALHAAGGGHVGGSASAADLLAALYFHFAENTYVWHSNTVNDEILARALAELEAL